MFRDRMFERRPRRLKLRRPKLQKPAMNRLIPNMLTVAALCAGLTAIRFGLQEQWKYAVIAVVIAGIFDGLDGRMARLLNGTSKFGAELDSLADFISFGVAPAVLVFIWSLDSWSGLGWIFSLNYAVCCALRLARFNTAIGDPNPPPWAKNFFVGVPAPAGAGLVLLPMAASFEIGPGWLDQPWVSAAWMTLIAGLMVSRIPTFSIKQIKIPQDWMLTALLVVGILVAMIASAPWITYVVAGLIYAGTIPVAIWTRARMRAAAPPVPPVSVPQPMTALPASDKTSEIVR